MGETKERIEERYHFNLRECLRGCDNCKHDDMPLELIRFSEMNGMEMRVMQCPRCRIFIIRAIEALK